MISLEVSEHCYCKIWLNIRAKGQIHLILPSHTAGPQLAVILGDRVLAEHEGGPKTPSIAPQTLVRTQSEALQVA